jgi:hypothetical protein
MKAKINKNAQTIEEFNNKGILVNVYPNTKFYRLYLGVEE